ncbi:hypothetical protein K435DRAFT_830232 [Dendrothele bispora CBS 962.96]|uniref:Uncharacterized protein n=1 Tax=Dendrothele bispora (strain CBS 962.96) TaxID=1314807 RepID=A0A4S8LMC1_DENBC|nr:hypothetical protein K435DRAFT_830232 [Dendrothele bispora CBS 962.96]
MTRHLATLRDQIPLVRTSSKSLVKRMPDAPKSSQGLPPPSSELLAKARHTQALEPILFPKGCSPWRPAAVMSTTRCENYSFPWIFKDCQEHTGHNRGVVLYQPLNLSSRQTDFKDRLTHVQLLLPWNLSPLQSSRISLEYLLLPPRSALEAASSPTSTPAYSSARHFNADGEVWVSRLSAIHFQG